MTRNLEPGLEPQAHVRVRMYRYSGATILDIATVCFETTGVRIATDSAEDVVCCKLNYAYLIITVHSKLTIDPADFACGCDSMNLLVVKIKL
jgi:hypothetical protein